MVNFCVVKNNIYVYVINDIKLGEIDNGIFFAVISCIKPTCLPIILIQKETLIYGGSCNSNNSNMGTRRASSSNGCTAYG
jgi:hypothetical protein